MTVSTTTLPNDTSAFSTGENTSTGYVARWINIQPGPDGDFKVRTEANSGYYGYGPSVFQLKEEPSGPTQYTLTTTPGTGGSITRDPAQASYDAGSVVSLTAVPNTGYSFTSWGDDLSGSTNPTTITMDGNKSVTASFTLIPPTCYALTRGHTGNGADPTASPTSSTGCAAGQYVSGESITLTAAPDSGHQVGSWNGTTNDSSTANTNTVTMPASAHSAGVNYVVTPPSTLVCESFNAFTPGSPIGTYAGWYAGGAGPVVTAGNGVAGSIGLGNSKQHLQLDRTSLQLE